MPYRISGEFICRRVCQEFVLLNANTGEYYGLNEVGADFLERVDGVRGVREIVEELAGTYDAPRERIERDMGDLIESLVAHGILVDV